MDFKDICLLLVGAIVFGFPIGYIVGSVISREFYKK